MLMSDMHVGQSVQVIDFRNDLEVDVRFRIHQSDRHQFIGRVMVIDHIWPRTTFDNAWPISLVGSSYLWPPRWFRLPGQGVLRDLVARYGR